MGSGEDGPDHRDGCNQNVSNDGGGGGGGGGDGGGNHSNKAPPGGHEKLALQAPIHIAVVCPEPALLPSAPAFDDAIAVSTCDAGARGGGVVAARRVTEFQGEGSAERDRSREREWLKRGRATYTVGVRAVGPPRVVLEGR